METCPLTLQAALPVAARNAGLFVSRGQGIHPTRRIDSHELIFVRQGTLGMQEDGRPFDLGPGETLLLLPGREHGGTREYPKDLHFYWIHFHLAQPTPPRPRKGTQSLTVPQHAAPPDPDRLAELFRRFLDDQEADRLTPLSGSLLVLQIFCAVALRSAPEPDAESAASALAARADQYVRTHFHEPLSTAVVAYALRCNPDYLGRVFRAAFGHTLTEGIHRCRVRHARRMLLESSSNVDEIARACGYADVGYFRRVLKRQEGLSPRAYRRLYARAHVNTE